LRFFMRKKEGKKSQEFWGRGTMREKTRDTGCNVWFTNQSINGKGRGDGPGVN